MRAGVLLLFVGAAVQWGAVRPPELVRIYPLGGQAGMTVGVEILGKQLSNLVSVEFDTKDLVWEEKGKASPGKVSGEIRIAPDAALGAHRLRVITLDGPSDSVLFNVGQFPAPAEVEPNDQLETAQRIASLPAEIQGRLDGAPDIDIYAVTVRKGERWVFDLRSIEDGSAVEARMILMDSAGKQIAFNDDRDDYNENPRIEYTFAAGGTYYVKLDQYRGPRGFNFGKLCSYTLRISGLPVVKSVYPLALRRGAVGAMRLTGSGLESVEKVYLTELREAEYARMTYPFTMPVRFGRDPERGKEQVRINGHVKRREAGAVDVTFAVPAGVRPGVWGLWTVGGKGAAPGLHVLIVDEEVVEEGGRTTLGSEVVVNGQLAKAGEKDVYRVDGRAGEPLHFWTVAAQLGVPYMDTVLTLRDGTGKKVGENDDVVAGQGTLLGNPDSSLFYTPAKDGPLTLEVRDRTRRGGQGFEYCLRVKREKPGFQLFTTPENVTIARGGKGAIKVHLIRETGFEGEVDIWLDGLPAGVSAAKGQFRADQLFEPNADGADMIIPEMSLEITAPESLAEGEYPIRVYGAAVKDKERAPVEAHATLMQGPLLDLWNFTRRPLPAITMTVVQPFDAELMTGVKTLRLEPGKSVTLELTAENVPADAPIRLVGLPAGVEYRLLGREGSQVTVSLEASEAVEVGTYEISAETELGRRRAPTGMIGLRIEGGGGKKR